jgi:hypothetical protein
VSAIFDSQQKDDGGKRVISPYIRAGLHGQRETIGRVSDLFGHAEES